MEREGNGDRSILLNNVRINIQFLRIFETQYIL
jgi:hypothetical protein